ncbi:MAG: DUF3137 domain-containing protein [Candidatus Omnitrophica bacterium]|nr:DUF3137 domain-containing protein [Candidatus Omnitrophota bacterium]
MKSAEEFAKFFETSLQVPLAELEQKRKQIVFNIWISLLVAFGVLSLLSIFIGSAALIIFPIAALIVFLIVRFGFTKNYVQEFKDKVIRSIVAFIDPSLNYRSDGFIPMDTFMSSEIFKVYPDRYNGDDFVSGIVGKTQVTFSELHAEYKTETTDKDGHRQEYWHTIFKGLLVIADFNKNFEGKTVVLPDTAERLFGGFGKMLQSWNLMRGQLIQLEDPEFEKLFAVYGDNQVEARYILSTSLMKRIVDFKNKSGKQIYLSFVGSRIYVAISYSKSLFEPRVFKTLLDIRPAQEYFTDLELALGVVDDLNLNTRIWSKQ